MPLAATKLPHPLMAKVTILAAKVTSGGVVGLLERMPPFSALAVQEVVPISGRLRIKVPPETPVDRDEMMEYGYDPNTWKMDTVPLLISPGVLGG
jgi:hypothetical protein